MRSRALQMLFVALVLAGFCTRSAPAATNTCGVTQQVASDASTPMPVPLPPAV